MMAKTSQYIQLIILYMYIFNKLFKADVNSWSQRWQLCKNISFFMEKNLLFGQERQLLFGCKIYGKDPLTMTLDNFQIYDFFNHFKMFYSLKWR